MSHATTSSLQPKTTPKQVGGTHYMQTAAHCPHCHGEIQHWDLYANAPGLVYSATKHITRHRVKNGKEDLLKAITEIQKIIEQEYPDSGLTTRSIADHEIPRAKAGGPNDCEHGYAFGIFCIRCYNLGLGTNGAQKAKLTGTASFASAAQEFPEPTPPPVQPVASEVAKPFEYLDGAEAARARAEAYALQRPDEDVPVGWVLERCTGNASEQWHFRQGSGGQWSAHYPSRSAALSALIAAKETIDA